MSSSKIFKEDPFFVPKTLVQEVITETAPRPRDTKQPFENQNKTDRPNIEEEQAKVPQPEVAPKPEPSSPPPPQPKPEIDIQALKQEAYDQGVADCTAGLQQEVELAVSAFHQACQKIGIMHHSLLERYRSDIINTVIGLSQKIIGQELITNRDVIAKTLENALQQAIAGDEFIVTIHPDDLNAVEHTKNELKTKIRGLKNIIIQTDQEVSRGGCLIESKTCSVDATIATQLESAREFLEENTLSLDENGDMLDPPPVAQTEVP